MNGTVQPVHTFEQNQYSDEHKQQKHIQFNGMRMRHELTGKEPGCKIPRPAGQQPNGIQHF